MHKKETRGFSSKFGFLMAAVGSAIGLGNLWSFPYKVGQGGGAAFVLIYIVMVVFIGAVALIGELYLGKRTQTNIIDAYTHVSKKSKWVGLIAVIAPFLILTYYPIIGGWSIKYAVDFIGGIGVAAPSASPENMFTDFISSGGMPILYLGIFMAIVFVIVLLGVKKGIEKASKIMMPLLFVCLIVVVIKSLTLPGRMEGLEYLFKPDFSKLNASVILAAMGQVFFSMSLGMGINVAYGSYMKRNMSINKSVGAIAIMDTVMALLAGIAIFPAVFTYDINPSQGPGLLFSSLAQVFHNMAGGRIFGAIFFCLVILAAVTSSIAILEVPVQYITEKFKLPRKLTSAVIATLAFGIGVVISLSFGLNGLKIGGVDLLTVVDVLTQQILLPIVSCATCLLIGWKLKPQRVMRDLGATTKKEQIFYEVWNALIKYVTPIAIATILVSGFVSILNGETDLVSKSSQLTAIIIALIIVTGCITWNALWLKKYRKATLFDDISTDQYYSVHEPPQDESEELETINSDIISSEFTDNK